MNELNLQVKNRESGDLQRLNFVAFADSIHDTISIITLDGVFLFANDRASANMIGSDGGVKIEGRSLQEFLPEQEVEKLLSQYKDVVEKNETIKQEIKVTLKNRDAWFINRLIPVYYGKENNSAVLSISIEISEKILAETACSSSELKFENLVDSLNDGLILIKDGSIIYANKKVYSISGFSQEDIVGKPFSVFFTDEEASRILKKYKRRLSKEIMSSRYFAKSRLKNGDFIDIEVFSQLVPCDGEEVLQIIIKDITTELRAKKELKENEEKFRFLSKSSFEGIIVHKNGLVLEINDAFEKLTGYSENDIKGKNLFDFIISKDTKLEIMKNLKEHEAKPYIITNYKKDGSSYCMQLQSKNVKHKGEIIRIASLRDVTEQVKLQEDFQEANNKLNSIMSNLPGLVFRCRFDPHWTMLFLSKGCEKLLEYEPDLIINNNGITFDKIIHKDDRSFVRSYISSNIEDKNNYELEYRVITKTGKVKWVWEKGRKIIVNGEEIIEGFIVDITARKLTEEKLATSESKYKALFDGINDSVFVYTFDKERFSKIIEVNNNAINKYGYSRNEFLNMALLDFTSSAYKIKFASFESKKKLHIEKWIVYESEHINKNGEIFPVEISSRIFDMNNMTVVMSMVRDISSRKNAEKRLKESETKFRLIFENKGIATAILSPYGKINMVNENCATLSGYSVQEMESGMTWLNLSHNEDVCKIRKLIRDAVSSNFSGSNTIESRIVSKSGKIINTLVNFDLLKDSEEWIASFVDVSVLKKIESELVQKNKELLIEKEKAEESDRLKSAFLSNMSHEIRTPMNGILGFTRLLKKNGLAGEEKDKYIDIIHRSGNRMLNTINDIIDISKIESGVVDLNMNKVDLISIIDEIHNLFLPIARKKNLQLILTNSIKEDVYHIYTDKDKLNSILTNLIKNALKFTFTGFVEIVLNADAEYTTIEIVDSGIGIPENRKDAIFDRFVQADIADTNVFEGSGLGLTITRAYIEMLSGNLDLETEDGSGTKFVIKLPNNLEFGSYIKPKIMIEKTDNNTENKKNHILIAEDDEVSFELLKIALGHDYGTIHHAENGFEAVNFIRENNDVQLVIMDIKMPVMGGLEATREIRKFNKHIGIIGQTAYALSGDEDRVLEAGCNDYISKPIDIELLKEKMALLITARREISNTKSLNYDRNN